MLKIIKVTTLSVLIAVTGCVSIPSEAPELSVELGKRIAAIEESNITLLNRFFDQKRKEVDKFIEEEWVPEFANHFFSNKTISDAWETIVSEDDKKQRLLFLVKTGPRLIKKINEKRLELIQPLDALERRIELKIREEYTQARAINNSITSFLLSASKVVDNRNRYLEIVNTTDASIGRLIDETDDAVSVLIEKKDILEDKSERSQKFLGKVREIRDSI
ncbi:hypothetical protein Q4540_09100 [Pseudoalteromonas carrageenovora]|uniref:hypothetical protein n=1 Tax=Pseudoalteromonas carrageenovora TaxID=227 RepID=UPI0026E3792A|nr:hypothetical protein [Pseudoalteromonas carrageenovora]MDO6636745.1 hypothetical protein [Pseudoalteromonas carrageenovora]MDO6648651.1 hypothetical protein [Pseudoalteromonas carrageenovora]